MPTIAKCSRSDFMAAFISWSACFSVDREIDFASAMNIGSPRGHLHLPHPLEQANKRGSGRTTGQTRKAPIWFCEPKPATRDIGHWLTAAQSCACKAHGTRAQ